MDDRRFDALTRAFAKGSSRRSVLKGLLGGLVGGAGAVAATSVFPECAGAQECNPSQTQVECPAGSVAHEGSMGGLEGLCCNGHGNCCGRNCVNGTCGPAVVEACAACTTGQVCCGGVCVTGDCCDNNDCADGCQACSGNVCSAACAVECCYAGIQDPAEWYCRAEGTDCCYDEQCEGGACVRNFCEYGCIDNEDCASEQTCCYGVCLDGVDRECCRTSADCVDGCRACSYVQPGDTVGFCTGACYPEPCCTIGDPQDWYCQPEGGCCYDEDCPPDGACVNGFCEFPCREKGDSCEWDDDCCDDLACHHGICKVPKHECGHKDDHCKADDDCCRGFHCKHGKCRKKLPKPEKPAGGTTTVSTLPSTGTGDDDSGAGWLGAAALGAAAAYIAGKKLREETPAAKPVEE